MIIMMVSIIKGARRGGRALQVQNHGHSCVHRTMTGREKQRVRERERGREGGGREGGRERREGGMEGGREGGSEGVRE